MSVFVYLGTSIVRLALALVILWQSLMVLYDFASMFALIGTPESWLIRIGIRLVGITIAWIAFAVISRNEQLREDAAQRVLVTARSRVRGGVAKFASDVEKRFTFLSRFSDRTLRREALERVCAARMVGDAIRDLRDAKGVEGARESVNVMVQRMRTEADLAPSPRLFGRGSRNRAVHEVRMLAIALSDPRTPEATVSNIFHLLDRAALDLEETIDGDAQDVQARARERARILVEPTLGGNVDEHK